MSTKRRTLHRLLSVLLAAALLLSCGAVTAFAAADETDTKEAIYLGVPAGIADGVYYADVNMKNASNPAKQYSMGNAALRGSVSYKTKQPTDTDYRPIVIVRDGKATALLEFMPMGFLGMYGFMMELEGVYPGSFTRYGSPNAKDADTVFTKTRTLTYQKTVDGSIVYDGYNDPESDYKFDGGKLRPAGFGKEAEYLDIVDQYYSHLLALDVTPVMVKNGDDDVVPVAVEDYTGDHAAFCHVFVPVMFDISASSGDQYARMEVNWKSLEKIEDPESNVQYMLFSALQTDTDGCTPESVAALESACGEVRTALENVWAKQHLELSGSGLAAQPVLDLKSYTEAEQTAMAQKLKAAVDGLEPLGDKAALDGKLAEAKALLEKNGELYTADSAKRLSEAVGQAESLPGQAGQSAVDAALKGLIEAMELLTYRDADYSAVDKALAAIPADLSPYTDESAAAVEAARAAVVRGKNITEQSAVDAMAKAIVDAVAKLERKSDGGLDFARLPDGVYAINFTMVKMNRSDLSMSNDAVSHTAKLTVKDGSYTLTVNFKGLHYLNRFGYLAKLSYYDNGYTYGEYGAIQGVRKAAAVLSVQKNADGSDVTDEFNTAGGSAEGIRYPETVSFPLVDTAKADPDGFIALHVFVPVMEDISAGTGDQDVLMKLDRSSLKAADDNDPVFRPDKPEELSPAVDVTDGKTGVQVKADKGVLPEGVQITVTEISSGIDSEKAAAALGALGKQFKLYDVRFIAADGSEVTPTGTVTLIFPVSAGFTGASVYRIGENGAKTLIRGTLDGGSYSVITKTAGKYALVETGVDTQNPQTGDTGRALPWLIAAAAFSALPVLAAAKRRYTEGE